MSNDSFLYFYQDTMSFRKLIVILICTISICIFALIFSIISFLDRNAGASIVSLAFLIVFSLASYGAIWQWRKGCMNWLAVDRKYKLFFKQYQKEIVEIDLQGIDSIFTRDKIDGGYEMKILFKDRESEMIPPACIPFDIKPLISIIKAKFEKIQVVAVANWMTDKD